MFECASGLLHLAIALASASILIDRLQPLWSSIAGGLVSLVIMAIGIGTFALVPSL